MALATGSKDTGKVAQVIGPVVDVAFSGGEPMLHPDLDELIRHIRGRGMMAGLIDVALTGQDLTHVEGVGNYAIAPTWQDGHNTGIYSWDYLYFLGSQQDELWKKYEERLAREGVDRDAPMSGAKASSCGHSH